MDRHLRIGVGIEVLAVAAGVASIVIAPEIALSVAAALALVGLAVIFWPARSRMAAVWPRGIRERLRRRSMRHWTAAGLNWRVLPESHAADRDGRMRAILSITPVPGVELPQPLDIVVACAGQIGGVSTRFYADQARLEGESSGDIEIEAPEEKTVRLRLCSPKLLPPARLDLILHSKGNAEVKVVDVKRAPRRH